MENKNEKEDKKKNENKKKRKIKKIKKMKIKEMIKSIKKTKNFIQNIDNNYKKDSTTFLKNLIMFDKNFKKEEKEKVPNINNNLNQIKNNEGTEYDSLNVNENLINPYPNFDTNPFRQNGDYLNLAQNQEQINLLRIIADNLANNNQGGFSYSAILISYIICFLFLTYNFYNHDGFMYGASISLYCMILSLSCVVSLIYLKEIKKINKNK